jgi:hypothetical protein
VERAGGDTQWGNLFTYAANNPVTFVDANGMDFLGDVWGGIVGGAGWIWDNIIFGIPNEIISSINWYAHATDAERAGFWAGIFAGIVVGVTILLIAASCLVGCEGLLLLAPLAAFIAGTAAAGIASIAVTKALGGQPTAEGTMHAMFWGGLIAGGVAGAGSARPSARGATSEAPKPVGGPREILERRLEGDGRVGGGYNHDFDTKAEALEFVGVHTNDLEGVESHMRDFGDGRGPQEVFKGEINGKPVDVQVHMEDAETMGGRQDPHFHIRDNGGRFVQNPFDYEGNGGHWMFGQDMPAGFNWVYAP